MELRVGLGIGRRRFLKASSGMAAAVAAGLLVPRFADAATHQLLGVQLYTIRKLPSSDLPANLAKIRAIGFEEVETYWDIYTYPAKQLRQMISDAGLTVPSGHFNYSGMEAKFDYAVELGVQTMVCPILDAPMRTADGFRKAADQFNKWGEKAKSLGMQFAFHNHNYEFHSLVFPEGGCNGWEILMHHTDPALVKLEMDCYWMTQAGNDPLQMLHEYRDRIRLLHVKDRKAGFPPSQEMNPDAEHFTEVGSGTISWKTILPAAQKQGVRHFYVEQDSTQIPVFESLRRSYRSLRTVLP
jgi:sugar phosphate isomerase/epimerase